MRPIMTDDVGRREGSVRARRLRVARQIGKERAVLRARLNRG
jgi:hypothetical protein